MISIRTLLCAGNGRRAIVGAALLGALQIAAASASAAAAPNQLPESTPAPDWASIGTLTLEQAKRIALAANPSVEAAASRVRAAAAAVRVAQASYFPMLTVTADATYMGKLSTAQLDINLDPYERYAVAGNVSWLLFDGFARRFGTMAARHGEQASREADADVRRLLVQALAAGFHNALLAQENITIARQDAEFNRALLIETRTRFEAGTASRSEVLNFDIRAAQAHNRELLAQLGFQTASTALAALLGVPSAKLPAALELVSLQNPGPAPPCPDLAPLLAKAPAQRPDLREHNRTVAQLEAQVRAARGAHWPTVSLLGSYGSERLDNLRFNDNRDSFAFVGLTVTWPLFTGRKTMFEVRSLEAQLAAATRTRDELQIRVFAELRREHDSAQIIRTQVGLQENIHQMTSEVRDLVRREYAAGRASLTRLNETQTDLVRAAAQLAATRIRYRQALENLAAAAGQNLDFGGNEL